MSGAMTCLTGGWEGYSAKGVSEGSKVPTVGYLASGRLPTTRELETLLGPLALVGAPPDGEGQWSYVTVVLEPQSDDSPWEALRDAEVYGLKKRQAGFAETIMIGRSSSNDVVVNHPSLSKLHARVRTSAEGLVLSDADSKNGTWVNGERLRARDTHLLKHGDEVTLGARVFQIFRTQRLHTVLSSIAV